MCICLLRISGQRRRYRGERGFIIVKKMEHPAVCAVDCDLISSVLLETVPPDSGGCESSFGGELRFRHHRGLLTIHQTCI